MEKVLLMNWDGIKSLTFNLGVPSETFGIPEDTAATLEEIIEKLIPSGESYCWDVHFQLLKLNFVEKQLWPILKFLDEEEEDHVDVLSHSLKLANHLNTPMNTSENGQTKSNPDLIKANRVGKQSFLAEDVAPVLFKHIFKMMKENKSPYEESCVTNCLRLFYNLIWSPDDQPKQDDEVTIFAVKNLLEHGLSEFIQSTVNHPSYKDNCFRDVSQLLHILLKVDPSLKKHLLPSTWTRQGDIIVDERESCLGSAGSPRSCSSQSGTPPNSDKPGILVENPLTLDTWVYKASGSSTSNAKLSRLGKRCLTDEGNGVTSAKHLKSADGGSMELDSVSSAMEYVRSALGDTVTCYMASGFGPHVQTFIATLVDQSKIMAYEDLELFFTLLNDFIPFSLLTSWENIEPAFCVETFSFLLHDGISLSEEIFVRTKEGRDTSELHQRLFKCVSLWQKMIKCLHYYMENSESVRSGKPLIIGILRQLEQIWQFFIFMIRLSGPDGNGEKSLEMLKSLVMTNHRLLLILENKQTFQLQPVIEQYAKVDMMDKYADVLEHFATNSTFLNTCLFTMMHHIAGDCHKLDVMVKPRILNTLVQITEHELPLPEVFEEFIDYVFDRFIKLIDGSPSDCAALLSDEENRHSYMESWELDEKEECPPPWTELENTILCLHYLQNITCNEDILQTISDGLVLEGISKSHQQILKQLYYIGLLEAHEYKKLEAKLVKETESQSKAKVLAIRGDAPLEACVKKITEKGYGHVITWLQKFILDACYARLGGRSLNDTEDRPHVEPLQYVSHLLKEMVPLVPFTRDQDKMLLNPYFTKVLEELNFVMPQESGMMYPRIPHWWTAKNLYEKALILAGHDQSALPKMKFSMEELENAKNGCTEIEDNFFDEEPVKPPCFKDCGGPQAQAVN